MSFKSLESRVLWLKTLKCLELTVILSICVVWSLSGDVLEPSDKLELDGETITYTGVITLPQFRVVCRGERWSLRKNFL